jgi:glycosyltransferase involved in cell wall biosynthesis
MQSEKRLPVAIWAPSEPGFADSASSPEPVVHLLGKLTDAVFSFLGPATEALAGCGVEQVVVMIDDDQCRRYTPQFHPSIKLRVLPERGTPWRTWRSLLRTYAEVVEQVQPAAVHVHGAISAFTAARLLRQPGTPAVDSFFSPHGSKFLGRTGQMGTSLVRALRRVYGRNAPTLIANVPYEARSLARANRSVVTLVECPVSDTFFGIDRCESMRPRVLTSGYARSRVAADRYAQLAVLLAHRPQALVFEWIGGASESSLQRLQAAEVQLSAAGSAAERASRMVGAWIFLAPASKRGFPLHVAEAMAAGLPCVTIDNPANRDLIEDGRTGFLCRDHRDFLFRIEQLLDSEPLRRTIGEAAQSHARERFSARRFRASILAAYRHIGLVSLRRVAAGGSPGPSTLAGRTQQPT